MEDHGRRSLGVRGPRPLTMEDALVRYVRDLFAPEDEVLTAVRERHQEEGLPDIWISPEEAKIIAVLLTAVGAARVLEVGTLGGYSGVWMARALPPGGRLVTIEVDERRAQVARRAFEEAGVADRVELIVGAALDVLPALAGPFDAVFLDADKAPLPAYLDHALRVLRRGGLLLCDNTFLDGRVVEEGSKDSDVRGMREYNARVARDPRLSAAVIPVRDGLCVAVKVRD